MLTAAAGSETRDRLVRFYRHYNPEKVHTVNAILESFAGNEAYLFESLVERYGPEPEPSVSPAKHHPSSSSPARQRADAMKRNSLPLPAAGGPQGPLAPTALFQTYERLQQVAIEISHVELAPLVEHLTQIPSVAGLDALETLKNLTLVRRLTAAFLEEAQPILKLAEEMRGQSIATQPRRETPAPEAPATLAAHRVVEDGIIVTEKCSGCLTLLPPASRQSVLAAALEAATGPMVSIVLHPGHYYENFHVGGATKVELKASHLGASIEMRPLDPSKPIISVSGALEAVGVTWIGNAGPGGDDDEPLGTALLHVTNGGEASLVNCHFTGGGISVHGTTTTGDTDTDRRQRPSALRTKDCTLRNCGFAAIFVVNGAFAELESTQMICCECGVRCRDGTIRLVRCRVSEAFSDGVICHGSVEALLEETVVTTGEENGVLLSPQTMLNATKCVVSLHKHYGFYVPHGAKYTLHRCRVQDNRLGEYNRPPATTTATWLTPYDASSVH